MKHIDDIGRSVEQERGLAWMMRIVGLLVVAGSIFFLTRSLSLNPAHDYFFAMTMLVGIATLAASWLQPSSDWQREGQPQMELVRTDDNRQ